MAEQDKHSKTEDPTTKKLKDAREKGRVPRSQEINSALILITGVTLLNYLTPWILNRLKGIMRELFTLSATLELSQTNFFTLFLTYGIQTMIIVAPMMLGIMVVGVMTTVFQGGFVFSYENLKFDIKKLDPVKGFGRLFSMQSVVKLLMSLAKVIPMTLIVYITIKQELNMIMQLQAMAIYDIMSTLGAIARKMSYRVCLFLVVLAVADYFYQKWQFKDNMKMTKQEVKDELKNTEGDPRIKRQIRKLQYEVAMRRMMADVPKADVVITNPTHLAVALKYEAGMDSPLVVAKGARLQAERIKEMAQLHDIPIVENKPLARTLFASVEIGGLVPEFLFAAVAEVLAYVYQIKNRRLFAS